MREHDPVSEGYRTLRWLGERYVDMLNRRERTEPGTDSYEVIEAKLTRLVQDLNEAEQSLANLLGVPNKGLWHPLQPRMRRGGGATPPPQLNLEGI